MDPEAKMAELRDAYAEVVDGAFDVEGIRLTLCRVITFGGGDEMRYGIRIERERTTASGRPGKATKMLTLISKPGERPADMLRTLAEVFDGKTTVRS